MTQNNKLSNLLNRYNKHNEIIRVCQPINDNYIKLFVDRFVDSIFLEDVKNSLCASSVICTYIPNLAVKGVVVVAEK